jgi:hypothetical protein
MGRRTAGVLAGLLAVELIAGGCGDGFDPPACGENRAVVEIGDDGRRLRGDVISYESTSGLVAFHFEDVTIRLTFERGLAPGGSVPASGALTYDSGGGLASCSDPPDHEGTLYADDDGAGYTFEVNDLGSMDLLGCWNERSMIGCMRFVDQDRDGVTDAFDQCPADDEDHDQFEDEDGCPDRDNDQDGIEDDSDRCPDEAGPAPDGCPA